MIRHRETWLLDELEIEDLNSEVKPNDKLEEVISETQRQISEAFGSVEPIQLEVQPA
jgi:hypothetical protein